MRQSIKVAFSSMAVALGAVCMFFTGVIPVGTYAIPAISGAILVPVVMEIGAGWAWAAYCALSVLSLLTAADREAAFCFVLFFGCYPILKANIEKLRLRPLQLALKLAAFNAAAVLEFYLSVKLLSIPAESFQFLGVSGPWLLLASGNIVFLLYDYTLSLLIAAYIRRFHDKIRKWLQPGK